MSLSTLRPPLSMATLTSLTDDSLLVILRNLTVPQLFSLLSLSRRLHYLIEHYTLPQYRSLLMPEMDRYPLLSKLTHFCKPFRLYSALYEPMYTSPLRCSHLLKNLTFGPWMDKFTPISSFPPTLPLIMPRIESLSFVYFLGNPESLSVEENQANQIFTGYLSSSSWSMTLVSLHLHLNASTLEEFPIGFPEQLNHLPSLRHLYLKFQFNLPCAQRPAILPDSLPVLGQLTSFYLHNYDGTNIAKLLNQLGPNLTHLSLRRVTYYDSETRILGDFASFLKSKPFYRQSLVYLEVWFVPFNFHTSLNHFQVFTLATQYLPFLERLYAPITVQDNLFTFFRNFLHLPKLKEVHCLKFTLAQLRTMRDTHPKFTLPRLSSIRQVGLQVNCPTLTFTEWDTSHKDEFFNVFLPLLAIIFSAVTHIEIAIYFNNEKNINYSIEKVLDCKIKEHFPTVRRCSGLLRYYSDLRVTQN